MILIIVIVIDVLIKKYRLRLIISRYSTIVNNILFNLSEQKLKKA